MKNRLQFEKSPYLLQHAENPVDWRAWGADAFDAARREDKPVFLSIGYSTCHWCHVMAHESFEDADSEGVEGKYYVFTPGELNGLLGSDADAFCRRYGVTEGGNFHGKNILSLIDAHDWETAPEGFDTLRRRVYKYRKARWLAGAAREHPMGHAFALLAFSEESAGELVCASKAVPDGLSDFLRQSARPGLAVLVKAAENAERLAAIAPFTADYPIPAEGATYYLCQNGSCQSPVDSIEELRSAMEQEVS